MKTQVEGADPPPLCLGPPDNSWASLCLDLAPLLQVNPDVLRRHLVCQLYSHGLDLRAEEVPTRGHVPTFGPAWQEA